MVLIRLARRIAWSLTLPALFLGLLHGIRVRSPRQVVLRTAKSTAEGLAPLLALAGAAGAALGWLSGTLPAVLSGLAGSALSTAYALRVARSAAGSRPGGFYKAARQRYHSSLPVQWQRDITYARVPQTGQPLLCDLWLPPPDIPATGTALLYLHGGGFFTSHKDFGTRAFFRHLAGLGHIVMDIDYRLAPGANLIEMQSDARRAVAWMKAHGANYGVRRIALAGGSAGSLLALLAAYTPHHRELTPPDLVDLDLSVQAAVSYYGVVDLAGLYHSLARALPTGEKNGPAPALLNHRLSDLIVQAAARLKGVDPASMRVYLRDNANLMQMGIDAAFTSLMGGVPHAAADQYRLVSPLTHAGPHCPPTLLLHGGHDHLLPPAGARSLAARLRDHRVPVTYIELPQTEHTFDLFLPAVSPPARAALFALERFLADLESA